MAKKSPTLKSVVTIKHDADKRKNIPTAEYQSVVKEEQQSPIRAAYQRRNRDLDPQLVWRGKDEQDWSDLVVHAPYRARIHALTGSIAPATRPSRLRPAAFDRAARRTPA